MKVEGTYQVPAPRERVWETLMDPAFLKQAIPGCEELVEEGDRRYRLTIKAGVGAIKGSFTGQYLKPYLKRKRLAAKSGGTRKKAAKKPTKKKPAAKGKQKKRKTA